MANRPESARRDSDIIYDIIIVGGGPAGLSAALTGRKRNMSVLVLTSHPSSSALAKAHLVDNYPGTPDISGSDLIDIFLQQAQDKGAEVVFETVISIIPPVDTSATDATFAVATRGNNYEGKTILLAPGAARLMGKTIAGEEEFLGKGVSICATCDGTFFKGQGVAVIGLGHDAPEEANFLQDLGCSVTYFAQPGRAHGGKEAAVPERPAELKSEIDFIVAKDFAIQGDAMGVTGIKYDDKTLDVAGVFILRDAVAPTSLISGLELVDGNIKTNANCQTNIPGVYAAGDATGQPTQIAKATGEGQIAVLSAWKRLNPNSTAPHLGK